MKRLIFGSFWAVLVLTGCVSHPELPPEVIATYTAKPIQLNGKLSDPAWQTTPGYPICRADMEMERFSQGEKEFFGDKIVEPGIVKLLWDDKYLYIGAEFIDSDVVSESKANQVFHYAISDVLEVFIKPANHSWYWELHATPKNLQSVYFFPGSGRFRLLSNFPQLPAIADVKVRSSIDGTLNNPWDRDKKWCVEVAIPRIGLEKRGVKLDEKEPWTILLCRYNHSRYLPNLEKGTYPQMHYPEFHSCDEYGRLKLVK